jgi:hypothetical protein
VLRRVFGPQRDEVTGMWRKLPNEESYALYSAPNIIQVIKSRIMICTEHIERTRERRATQNVLVGKSEGSRALE